MFTSRSQSGPSARHLDLKILLFGAGLLLLLLGIRFRVDWLIWSAIAPLAAAFVLRFVGKKSEDDEEGPRQPD
jgi:membrane protein implicated in regulation of membrane protease activity